MCLTDPFTCAAPHWMAVSGQVCFLRASLSFASSCRSSSSSSSYYSSSSSFASAASFNPATTTDHQLSLLVSAPTSYSDWSANRCVIKLARYVSDSFSSPWYCVIAACRSSHLVALWGVFGTPSKPHPICSFRQTYIFPAP